MKNVTINAIACDADGLVNVQKRHMILGYMQHREGTGLFYNHVELSTRVVTMPNAWEMFHSCTYVHHLQMYDIRGFRRPAQYKIKGQQMEQVECYIHFAFSHSYHGLEIYNLELRRVSDHAVVNYTGQFRGSVNNNPMAQYLFNFEGGIGLFQWDNQGANPINTIENVTVEVAAFSYDYTHIIVAELNG